MKKRLPLHYRLGWLLVALFGILVVYPATRRLLQIQLGMETLTFSIEWNPAAERAAASRMPDDYPVQLALATTWPSTSMGLDSVRFEDQRELEETRALLRRIEALVQRFPDRTSVYANQLRYMMLEGVNCRRDSTYHPSGAWGKEEALLMSPESLRSFDASAQKGAQLDPENAYFPMMRAVGLFAAHRDAEAMDSLKAAGRCTRWREYYQDETEGLDRLQRVAYGDRGAVQRLVNAEGIIFPQYGQARKASELAIHLILPMERAGKTEEGIEVRHAVMRCGGLMRAQGASIITTWVGTAIVHMATSDPGGVPPLQKPLQTRTVGEEQKQREERHQRYCAYLENQGQTQEAAWARAEFASEAQARRIISEAGESAGVFGRHFFDLSLCWLDNLALLVSGLVLLILGGAAHLAGGLHPRGKLWLARSGYVLAIVGGIWLWQWLVDDKSVGSYIWIQHMFTYLIGDGQDGAAKAMRMQWLVFGLTLLTPVLLIGLIGGISRFQRVPLATGLGRGLRGVAIPAALVLFLLYGLSLLPTAHTEAGLDEIIAQSVRNQPQDLTERSHKIWPGDPQP